MVINKSLWKVVKSGKSWQKWQKVTKIDGRWQKLVKGGQSSIKLVEKLSKFIKVLLVQASSIGNGGISTFWA